MKHILLTRFNVLMPGWNSQIHLDPSWLDGRFKLFEEMCLPSVNEQTSHNFEWLIFFDTNTPEQFKSKILELTRIFPFHAIYVEIFDLKKISLGIFEQFSGDKMLLTSRLDSDDILATDYIERLQKISSGIEIKSVINFDYGAILFSRNNRYSLYEYEDQSNPFTSLIEPFTSNLSTILAVKHTELDQFAKLIHVRDKVMWLQVVHGGNVSNRVRGKRVKADKYNENFIYMRSISAITQETDYELHFDNFILGTYRKLRDFFRSILKAIYFYFKK